MHNHPVLELVHFVPNELRNGIPKPFLKGIKSKEEGVSALSFVSKWTHIALQNEVHDKCQNIHILALNLHLLISLFWLFCSILFPFSVFCVFVGHGRKESVFGKVPSLRENWEDIEDMIKFNQIKEMIKSEFLKLESKSDLI
jgi:hypothetical protein